VSRQRPSRNVAGTYLDVLLGMNQLELVVEDLPRVQLEAPVNQVLLVHLLDSMARTRPIITIII
jgi:hypothetical protein